MTQAWMEAEGEDPRDILVVDDEPDLSGLVRFMLEKGTPHRILDVNDPTDALDMFREHPADLVISDIEMPGMNGLKLLESIKAFRPTTEVIMLTGRATFEAAVTAIHRQAFDFLEKPPVLERLLQTVHNALSRVRMREELDRTLGQVAAAKSLMERLGRDRARFQIPHERLIVACLVLEKVEATAGGGREELRALYENRRAAVDVDVNAFVRGEVERFFSFYPSMEMSLEIPATAHVIPIQISGLALSLHNVLENAVSATSRGGHVHVACAATEGGVSITVEDDGPGFPEGYADHFAEAFRGGAEPGRAGMGLAIARRALEEQNGTLTLRPHPTGGARLEIRLART